MNGLMVRPWELLNMAQPLAGDNFEMYMYKHISFTLQL